jgi:riboflavin-specific deaminase-like protein
MNNILKSPRKALNMQRVPSKCHLGRNQRGAAAAAIARIMLIALFCHSTVGFSLLPALFKRRDSVHQSFLHSFELHQLKNENLEEQDADDVSILGVTLKMAFDENWAVADDAEEKSERFTSPASLDLVHRLRRDSDCVLVGRTTVQRDNCTLTVRRVPLSDHQTQPVRVVIDSKLSLLKNEQERFAMFHDGLETIVYCSQECLDECKNTFLNNDSVTLVPLPFDHRRDLLSITDIVQDLKDNKDIHHVMVEGGPVTARLFLQEQLVDRAILIKAPVVFSKPVASHISNSTLKEAGLVLLGTTLSDGDVIEYWSRPGLAWPTENVDDWP